MTHLLLIYSYRYKTYRYKSWYKVFLSLSLLGYSGNEKQKGHWSSTGDAKAGHKWTRAGYGECVSK